MAQPDYATRRTRERAARIARARHNLAQRSLSAEDLSVARAPRDHVHVAFAAALGLAVVCHVGVAFAAFCSTPSQAREQHQPIKIQVRSLPVPPPAPVPVVEPKEVVPDSAPNAPPKPRPRAPEKAKQPEPAPPPSKEAAPPPIAIVGLTLESTSSSGQVPAFAVGQTLSGTTERIAASARAAVPDAPIAPHASVLPVSRNQRAAARAPAGVRVEPAQRLARIEPEYPPLLERQRIEADVTVRVWIAASGQLVHAELVRGAEQTAFNEAALAAARKGLRVSLKRALQGPGETPRALGRAKSRPACVCFCAASGAYVRRAVSRGEPL